MLIKLPHIVAHFKVFIGGKWDSFPNFISEYFYRDRIGLPNYRFN